MLYTPLALTKGLRDLFLKTNSEVASREVNIPALLCELQTSDTDREDYLWLGEAPQMEEYVDQLRTQGISDAVYTLRNRRWSASISVSRDLVADDKMGSILRRIKSMATVAARHPNALTVRALVDGTTAAATFYDGVPFFSAAHPIRGRQTAVQSNLITGGGTTVALLSADLELAIGRARRFLMENGEPYHEGLSRFAIVTPPELDTSWRTLLHGSIIGNTSNVTTHERQFEIISTGRLADVNDWYLLILDGPNKPLVWQSREPLFFDALEEGSELAMRRKEYLYETGARYNVGYSAWQAAIKVTNT